jgi:hypothetical protein
LLSAGYVVGVTDRMGVGLSTLTWPGHDLLDAIRNDTVWESTKTQVKKTVGSASLEVVKAVAEGITKTMLFGG